MEKFLSNRRNFLKLAGIGAAGLSLPLAFPALAEKYQNNGGILIYIGTYTQGKSEGIYLAELNPKSGALKQVGVTKNIENPSYLTIDPSQKFLYSVSEVSELNGKPTGGVSAFTLDKKTGTLKEINQQSSHGKSPCYISMDKDKKYVMVANYGDGTIAIYPVQSDGKLGGASDVVQHEGSSVDPNRQKGPHAHCIIPDPTNAYIFAVDLGLDKVLGYSLKANPGKLTKASSYSTKSGAGPRHLTFHPNGRFAFLINEMNSTMTALTYDSKNGELKEINTISTLPAGFTDKNSCADVHVHPNGKFLYGSNRGHDSIAVFSIDEKSGKISAIEHMSTQGKIPRNFMIEPSGKFLLAANQDTDNVVSFTIDNKTGKLKPTGHQLEVGTPVCLKVLKG
ncbi:lactonase family protein [soil metagenome]